MGIVNSKAFPYQLDRTIVDMYYDQFTTQKLLWSQVMKKTKAPKGADWSRADLTGLGASLREAGEGEAVEYQVPLEGNKITRYFKKYQLGFQITEEMLEDELHDKMKSMSAGLAKAAQFTLEAKVWALFNNAFAGTAANGAITKDSATIISDTHTTLSGRTIDNKSTADFSTTALMAAMEYFQSLYSEDDVPITEYLKTILCSNADQWIVADVLKSTGRVWDGINANGTVTAAAASYTGVSTSERMNLMNPANGVVQSWNYIPVRYFDPVDADQWFALSANFDGEVMFKREAKLQSADDVTTGNRLYRTSMRFLPMINEYRYIYGSTGS